MKLSIRLAAGTTAAAAVTGALVLGATGAPAQSGSAAQTKKVSHRGVGKVRIGMRYSVARNMGLVGPLREGCPIDDADSAALRAPLKGFVDVTQSAPRRIRHITVRGGATARGIGIGAPLNAVIAAFPGARVRTVSEFDLTFVRVPRSAGGKFDFIVGNTGRQRVRSIEVRRFFVCD